ncbi:MAG: fatty acid desaturase [Saprospiraceae bacterium]|jgi:beta-carotene hydroxylase|nr:fatty acid desaturase [Saprospiraceae bacterium]
MLRYKADIRSLVFMFITAGSLVLLWQYGNNMSTPLWIFCYAVQLLMAVIVSTIVHNHQHLPMWTVKWLNIFTDNFLTVFYGFPVFAWIPTHNSNHHVHVNKEPDYTKTYMVSEKNNLLTLLTYPSISGMKQQGAVGKYLLGLYNDDRRKFYTHLLQIISLIAWIVIALVVDWKKAVVYVIIPQQLSLFTVLVFNYIQHIHADEESEFNHSRNITGKVLNFLLLNNGLHTVHHLSPGVHWSKLREKHDKIAHKIDPRLNEENFAWYLFRVYILGLFSHSFQTENMRMERKQNLSSTSSN